MSLLIVPCGISGSGKSHLRDILLSKFSDIRVVSMDEIRKEMTGDVSDQSKNKEVYQELLRRTDELLKKDVVVYYDNTNITDPLKIATQFDTEYETLFVVMTDSRHIDLCYSRVTNDVADNKDRSRTPYEILEKQQSRWLSVIDHLHGNVMNFPSQRQGVIEFIEGWYDFKQT